MLNIPDIWVFLAFILSIFSSLLCIFWGIYFWNKSDDSYLSEELSLSSSDDAVSVDTIEKGIDK